MHTRDLNKAGSMRMLLIFLLKFLLFHANPNDVSLPRQEEAGFQQEGDLVIGAVVPVNSFWPGLGSDFSEVSRPLSCRDFSVTTYGCVQAMVFAIDEINREQTILPNLTLGIQIYDTCSSDKKAIEGTRQMLTGEGRPTLNYRCKSPSPLTAIIGESSSTISMSIARLLGLYRCPQISYDSTSPLLNNKNEFPSFFRTIPSDDSQAQLFHYMKGLRFKNKMGEEIIFDEYGNPPAAYDIINWQRKHDGTIHYVTVGSFDTRQPKGQELHINRSALSWARQGKEAPRSACSESCFPGYYKAGRRGQPACCYDCLPCSEGEVSEGRDSSKCWPCPSDQWPNERRRSCGLLPTRYGGYPLTPECKSKDLWSRLRTLPIVQPASRGVYEEVGQTII
ncbi:hypothetical protein NDU88_000644 [Pleurodeles waltl]|uniref:Uncharacterized protein n=1 Tax=Pleurodeles waltl TaxID=8319 RepID=A0AAV7KQH2_PLEWA|nr:hypothetical protein NDU88_000644 [Pleurodeles waltl]